jgi:cation:H+ antiporter
MMLLTFALLLGAAGVIYFSCEAFVNGVEWLGRALRLSATATGSILAAFGTALPESVVTLAAVAFDDSAAGQDIGIGAALGGPLVLSTVAYGMVGLVLLGNRRQLGAARSGAVQADMPSLRRDQRWFLAVFAFKIALGVLTFQGKAWFSLAFALVYVLYCWKELGRKHEGDEEDAEILEPLLLRPTAARPGLGWIIAQTALASIVVFLASRVFVAQIDSVGAWFGLPPQLAALLLSPVATELPETMNVLIWARQGKERLALANISGAMMIQATIPTAFALWFTPWRLGPTSLLGAATTAVAVLYLMWVFRGSQVRSRPLVMVVGLYAMFAAVLMLTRGTVG